jgi:isocitrate/isopropylmalate dehydrogenase
MLAELGESDAATRLWQAVEDVCRDGIRTRDVGGSASTVEVGNAIVKRLEGGT